MSNPLSIWFVVAAALGVTLTQVVDSIGGMVPHLKHGTLCVCVCVCVLLWIDTEINDG